MTERGVEDIHGRRWVYLPERDLWQQLDGPGMLDSDEMWSWHPEVIQQWTGTP